MYAAQVSGVIAVVVYGLYGSATAKWGLSPKVAESGIFDDFWDTIGFAITGMVFFFSGVSCVNFLVRSAQVMIGLTPYPPLNPRFPPRVHPPILAERSWGCGQLGSTKLIFTFSRVHDREAFYELAMSLSCIKISGTDL